MNSRAAPHVGRRYRGDPRDVTAAQVTGGKSASRMFEDEAARWEKTGEMQKGVSNAYGMAALRLWITSKGAKVDGVSDRLKRYHKAAEKQLRKREGANWYDGSCGSDPPAGSVEPDSALRIWGCARIATR